MNPKHKIRNPKKKGAPENREIPLLPRYLSDTAYGHTDFGPNRHNTNGRDITPIARGTTLGHPKHGYLEFAAVVRRSLMVEQQLMVTWGL